MATCGSDQHIIIWKKEGDKEHSQWVRKCDWKVIFNFYIIKGA